MQKSYVNLPMKIRRKVVRKKAAVFFADIKKLCVASPILIKLIIYSIVGYTDNNLIVQNTCRKSLFTGIGNYIYKVAMKLNSPCTVFRACRGIKLHMHRRLCGKLDKLRNITIFLLDNTTLEISLTKVKNRCTVARLWQKLCTAHCTNVRTIVKKHYIIRNLTRHIEHVKYLLFKASA